MNHFKKTVKKSRKWLSDAVAFATTKTADIIATFPRDIVHVEDNYVCYVNEFIDFDDGTSILILLNGVDIGEDDKRMAYPWLYTELVSEEDDLDCSNEKYRGEYSLLDPIRFTNPKTGNTYEVQYQAEEIA